VEGRALPIVFHLPPAPFHLSSGPVLRVLLGIGGGLKDLLLCFNTNKGFIRRKVAQLEFKRLVRKPTLQIR